MPYDFNIYHSQVTPSIPDYDTVNVVLTSDFANYATLPYVAAEINRNNNFFLPLSGGRTIEGNLGIAGNFAAANINATNLNASLIQASNWVFASGAPVVVSSQTFETPTTGISAVQNVIAISQTTYNALTIKRPNTLYVIV